MGEGSRSKKTSMSEEPAPEPRDIIRSYLGSHHRETLQQLRATIDRTPETSLKVLLALVEEDRSEDQAFELGCDLTRKVGERALGTLRGMLFDEGGQIKTKLLALRILAARGSLPDWRKLDEVARGTASQPLCAACLHHCDSASLSMRDRETFVWYLEHSDGAAPIKAALPIVEPLLDAWEVRDDYYFCRFATTTLAGCGGRDLACDDQGRRGPRWSPTSRSGS